MKNEETYLQLIKNNWKDILFTSIIAGFLTTLIFALMFLLIEVGK